MGNRTNKRVAGKKGKKAFDYNENKKRNDYAYHKTQKYEELIFLFILSSLLYHKAVRLYLPSAKRQ